MSIEDARESAVEHLSALLERDVVSVAEFNALVARVLASSSGDEVALVLAEAPAAVPAVVSADDVLVIENEEGVVKEAPSRLSAAGTELRNGRGVMKIDFRWAEIEGDEVDLDLENGRGVMKIVLPAGASVRVVEQRIAGGVFKNAARRQPPDPGLPTIRLHVTNGGGVLKVSQARYRRGRRRGL